LEVEECVKSIEITEQAQGAAGSREPDQNLRGAIFSGKTTVELRPKMFATLDCPHR
jgi:hypothetical protein